MSFYVVRFEGSEGFLAGASSLEALKDGVIKSLKDYGWKPRERLYVYEFDDGFEPEFRGDLKDTVDDWRKEAYEEQEQQ